jgi:hypothetical protein
MRCTQHHAPSMDMLLNCATINLYMYLLMHKQSVSERDAAQTAWSNSFMQLCTVLLALPLQGRKHLLGWIKDAVDPDVFLRRLLKPLHVSNGFQRSTSLLTSVFLQCTFVHICHKHVALLPQCFVC